MNRRLLILLALFVAACGKPLARAAGPRTVTADGRTIFGTLPVGPTDREVLTALPSFGTYRWGRPGAHFAGTTPEEDAATQTFEAHELRMDASEVLRAHGWREARDGELPMFELAVARYERTAEWYESQPDPRGRIPVQNPCRLRPVAQRANCIDPLPRDYPPIQVLQRGTDARLAFAIVRIEDRATAWWIAPRRIDLQRLTLELLQTGVSSNPGDTALER